MEIWIDTHGLSPNPSLWEGRQQAALHVVHESEVVSDVYVSPPQRGGLRGSALATKSVPTRSKPTFTKQEILNRWLVCRGRYLPYNPANKAKAKILRKNMTLHEKIMWNRLRKQEYRVLRQHTIDHYITDFYIASAWLVIEIDGDSHTTEDWIQYDTERTKILELYWLKVIRFANDDVIEKFEDICQEIDNRVWKRSL